MRGLGSGGTGMGGRSLKADEIMDNEDETKKKLHLRTDRTRLPGRATGSLP